MIAEFVEAWNLRWKEVAEAFSKQEPTSYLEIFTELVKILPELDPKRITPIRYGGYEGRIVFVVAEKGYTPHLIFTTTVYYGSCSACDTLERIRVDSSDKKKLQRIKDYTTLAMHMMQRMKSVDDNLPPPEEDV